MSIMKTESQSKSSEQVSMALVMKISKFSISSFVVSYFKFSKKLAVGLDFELVRKKCKGKKYKGCSSIFLEVIEPLRLFVILNYGSKSFH